MQQSVCDIARTHAGVNNRRPDALHPQRAPSPGTAPGASVPLVPRSFMCPITYEVMTDLVATQDDQVYERTSILEWLGRGHRTSPVTGVELADLSLRPVAPLRRAIEEYLNLQPGPRAMSPSWPMQELDDVMDASLPQGGVDTPTTDAEHSRGLMALRDALVRAREPGGGTVLGAG